MGETAYIKEAMEARAERNQTTLRQENLLMGG
jgi:hypothetical protein